MSAKPTQPGGFSYYVSDEQREAFQRLTPPQRLQWADEVFAILSFTPIAAVGQQDEKYEK